MDFSINSDEQQKKERSAESVFKDFSKDNWSLGSGQVKSEENENSTVDKPASERSVKGEKSMEEKSSLERKSIGGHESIRTDEKRSLKEESILDQESVKDKEESRNEILINQVLQEEDAKVDSRTEIDQNIMETDQNVEMEGQIDQQIEKEGNVPMDVEVSSNKEINQTKMNQKIEMNQNVEANTGIEGIQTVDFDSNIEMGQNIEMTSNTEVVDSNVEMSQNLEQTEEIKVDQSAELYQAAELSQTISEAKNNSEINQNVEMASTEMDQKSKTDSNVNMDHQSVHTIEQDKTFENAKTSENAEEDMNVDVKSQDSKTQQQLKVLIDGLSSRLQEQNDRIALQEQELKSLKENSDAIALLNNYILIKRKFEIDNVVSDNLKTEGNVWTSPTTFTHVSGYKYCIFMASRGFSVTLHIKVLEGEFDSMLKWPLKANFVVEILTPEGEKSIKGVTGEKRYKKPSEVETAYPFYFKLRFEDIYQAYLDLPVIENFLQSGKLCCNIVDVQLY